MLKKSALILQNLQVDYCPLGALEVLDGDKVIEKANELMDKFEYVIAAIDWHPANHISFAGSYMWRKIGQTMSIDGLDQKLMPFHCVANSFGAKLYPSLQKEKITHTIQQGIEANTDNYSAFYDVDKRRDTGLFDYLNTKGVERVFVMGLGIEEGVKHTVLDAISLNFKAVVIQDACGGWEPNAVKKTWKEMEKAEVLLVNTERVML